MRKRKSDSSKCSVESEDSGLGLKIVEDFYKARKPREYKKEAPTLRSDRIGLMVAPTIRAEHHNTADVHFVVSGQTIPINTVVKFTDTSLETRNWLRGIFGKSISILFPILTCSPLASLARVSQSLDGVKVSKTQEELFSLKSAEWLKLRSPDGFYLKMLKGFSIMTEAEHSKSSSPRWMNWGMTVNGKCLTLRLGYPKTGKGSLSSVLEEKVDEKYFLSGKMIAGLIKHQKHHKEQGHGFSPVFPDKQASSLTDRTGSTARGQDFVYMIHNKYGGFKEKEPRIFNDISPTIRTPKGGGHLPDVVETKPLLQQGINGIISNRADNYASTQEANAIKILRILWEEIGTKAFAKWGLRILNSFQQKEVLWKNVYGNSIRQQACEKKSSMDDSTLSCKKIMPKRELLYLWKRKSQRCSSQKSRLERQFIVELTESLQKLSYKNTSNTRIRRLTPIETERLQGFPDFFTSEGIDSDGNKGKISDTQRYKQMGNAVSVPVIEAIGKRLAQGVL